MNTTSTPAHRPRLYWFNPSVLMVCSPLVSGHFPPAFSNSAGVQCRTNPLSSLREMPTYVYFTYDRASSHFQYKGVLAGDRKNPPARLAKQHTCQHDGPQSCNCDLEHDVRCLGYDQPSRQQARTLAILSTALPQLCVGQIAVHQAGKNNTTRSLGTTGFARGCFKSAHSISLVGWCLP